MRLVTTRTHPLLFRLPARVTIGLTTRKEQMVLARHALARLVVFVKNEKQKVKVEKRSSKKAIKGNVL